MKINKNEALSLLEEQYTLSIINQPEILGFLSELYLQIKKMPIKLIISGVEFISACEKQPEVIHILVSAWNTINPEYKLITSLIL